MNNGIAFTTQDLFRGERSLFGDKAEMFGPSRRVAVCYSIGERGKHVLREMKAPGMPGPQRDNVGLVEKGSAGLFWNSNGRGFSTKRGAVVDLIAADLKSADRSARLALAASRASSRASS
jgi:hypothetical protein